MYAAKYGDPAEILKEEDVSNFWQRCGPGALQKELTKRELLNKIQAENKDNIEMLKAVIRKRIRDDVSIGIDPDCVTRTITSELMTF